MSVRHVSDRFNTDSNAVKMLGYTTADAYMFVDIVKPWWSTQINKTRVTFRVRNLTNEKYVLWGDPFYPDQVLLGAPRSYKVAASFKFYAACRIRCTHSSSFIGGWAFRFLCYSRCGSPPASSCTSFRFRP
jgi:hypothetical protein